MKQSDPRQAAIKRAVWAVELGLLERELTVEEAVARLAKTNGIAGDQTPRERAAAARQSRREEMLAELTRREREGRGRDAVKLVARDYAGDRSDPIEIESLARKLRRWRAQEK